MTFQSRSLRYLHGGIVVCVKGALRHSRESLANEELGKGRLGISNYCSQDVNGCLKKKTEKSELLLGREISNKKTACQVHTALSLTRALITISCGRRWYWQAGRRACVFITLVPGRQRKEVSGAYWLVGIPYSKTQVKERPCFKGGRLCSWGWHQRLSSCSQHVS